MTVGSPVQTCICCGGKEFTEEKVLWHALIDEWGLSPHETRYIDRQQGLRCRRCGSNLRTMALALAICRCYKHPGPFVGLVRDRRIRRLRVLEINEAGQLTQFLSELPSHTIARYPEVDMTQMPYRQGSFDLVIHSDSLEHVPQPIAGLAECYRVLSPGGYCVFTIPVIVDRMTRSRAGLAPSYHGDRSERRDEMQVQTEYGSDAWKHVMCAGFDECRLISPEFPSALAFVAVR